MLTRRKMMGVALGTAALAGMTPRLSHAQAPSKQDVFFDKDAPVLGNLKGDVTIVEFFDYQCPYCKQSHPTIRKVVEADGNVRLVMKDWPIFGGPSIFAAQAVLAAAQIGRYEPALEALMNTSTRLSEEVVAEAFDGAGIKMAEIVTSVNKHNVKISGLLDRNYNQASAFNFAGTPSFVIGASLYPGVLDEKALKEAIAKARG